MLAAVHPSPATNLELRDAFQAGQGVISVGRVEENVVSAIALNEAAAEQLPEKLVNMVSRRHAQLQVVAGQLQLQDLGAVNGTYVNDQRMERHSRRVLQDNDVVSFGGPATISLRPASRPNPWAWRVHNLHEFLASYVPPGQGPPAPRITVPAPAPAASAPAAGREVYSFSPLPAAAALAAGGLRGGSAPAGVAGPSGGEEEGGEERHNQQEEEVEAVVSPDPPPGGSGQPGSLLEPAAELRAPAAAAVSGSPPSPEAAAEGSADVQRDSVEIAELAALEAYEASQHGSAPQPSILPAAPLAQLAMADAQQPLQTRMPAAVPAMMAGAAAAARRLAGYRQPQQAHQEAQQQQAHQPAQQQVHRPQQQAQQAQQQEPELIDLTADSPVSPPARLQLLQAAARGGGRAPGGSFGSGAGSAEEAGVEGEAEVVELSSSSPTKRRHGTAAQAEQGAKRAKPSPDARQDQPKAATGIAAEASGVQPAAAAAAAAAAPGASPDVSQLQQTLVCPICQDLMVTAHALVPCGHAFCGECLAGYLATRKTDCPSCRAKSVRAPTRQHVVDSMADLLVNSLTEEDREARREKKASWNANKERLERQLAEPYEGGRGASATSGRGGGGLPAGGGLMAAITAGFFGVGGLGGLGAIDPLMMMNSFGDLGGHTGSRRGGAASAGASGRRRVPQVVAQHQAAAGYRLPAQQAVPQNEYRVEVSAQLSTARCAGCSQAIGELTTRVGVRPQQAASRSGAPNSYRWYHLGCLPAANWHEARLRGVVNLRGIPAAEQARVRENMRLQPGR